MELRHLADDVIDPIIMTQASEDLWADIANIRKIARRGILPRSIQMAEDRKVHDDVDELMRENGFYALGVPEKYGGLGRGILGDSLSTLEISYADMSTSLVPIANAGLFGRSVVVGGSKEQKERILPEVASGKLFGCYGLTETGGSSFRESIKTRAAKKFDRYTINGDKVFITEADRANMCVVFATMENGGIGAFLVPNKNNPPAGYSNGNGYEVTGKENKPGLCASATCRIEMVDVEVPEDDLLSYDHEGKKGLGIALKTLGLSRPTIAAQALGNAKFCLAYAMQYAQETERGDGIYLWDKELYAAQMGKMAGDLAQAVSYLLVVAKSIDNGDIGKSDILRMYSSTLKASTTDVGTRICEDAMVMMGGSGYTSDHPVAQRWIDGVVTRIYEGSNLLQMSHAGRSLASAVRKQYTV